MVAPIWTVARKRSGSSRSLCTETALRLPPDTSASRRELRRDTTAISAPAKTPLRRVKARMNSTFERIAASFRRLAHVYRRDVSVTTAASYSSTARRASSIGAGRRRRS